MIHLRSKLAIVTVSLLILCAPRRAPAQQTSGSQKSAEARLAAAAKPSAPAAAQDAVNLLSATHRFEQTAISPDGKKVAWVEDVITKHGVSTGDTVIFIQDLEAKAPPKRIGASRQRCPPRRRERRLVAQQQKNRVSLRRRKSRSASTLCNGRRRPCGLCAKAHPS